MGRVKVIITDDHPMLRFGLRTLLETIEDIEIVGEASHGKELIEILKETTPDLILLDVMMPEMDGRATLKWLKEQYPGIKVLIHTMVEDKPVIQELITEGADGYLLKSASREEIATAIQTVSQGKNYFSGELVNILFQKETKPAEEDYHVPPDVLTERELQIIQLIAEEYTNKEIAEKLDISPRTVDTHRSNLLRKLGLRNTAGLIRYAMRYKLIDI